MARNFENDENVKARKRAAKRSNNSKAGKPLDAEETTPVEEAPAPEEPTTEAPSDEGGIVAEAEQELAESKAEKAEGEAPAEEAPAEESAHEAPAEEAPAEGEAPTEEAPAEESAPEAPAEEAPAEESAPEAPAEEAGEYQAPEGESHDELINAYHEAISFGEVQKANELYKRLQDHRYQENKHRGKTEAVAEADAREHLAVAKELAAKHPELGEDGVEADKVMAVMEVYCQNGMKPAAALRQAVADLYPEGGGMGAPETPAETPAMPEAEPATPEALAEAPATPEAEPEEPGMSPADMEERMMKKRAIAEVPTASARNEAEAPAEKPTRSGAIASMKKARGQG